MIRLRTGPVAIFGAIFVVALIALLPMRLALAWFGLGDAGLAARSVTGPVWFGALHEAQFGALNFGDLRARLSPIQLLVGRARVDLVAPGSTAAQPVRAGIGVTRHSFGIDDMSVGLGVGTVFAPVPISRVDLDDVSFRFDGNVCTHAEGRVKASLAGGIAGLALTQGLSGTARCDGNALLLPLVSQAGTEAISLRVRADGGYTAQLRVQAGDPALADKLRLAGFQASGAGYTLSFAGHF